MITATPKQCPFCDGNTVSVKILDVPDDNGFPVASVCVDCKAQGPVIYSMDMDSNEPVDKWNERPTEERLTQMVMATEKRYKR